MKSILCKEAKSCVSGGFLNTKAREGVLENTTNKWRVFRTYDSD